MVGRKAFSLIELTIVLVIIGTLIGAVISGKSLIRLAVMSQCATLTANSPINSIEGLNMWFESGTTNSFNKGDTVDGNSIDSWKNINKQATGVSDAQAVSTSPTYDSSGTPSLDFDNNGFYVIPKPINWNKDFTVFVVAASDYFASSTPRGLVSNRYGDGSNNWWLLGISANRRAVYLEHTGDNRIDIDADVRAKGRLIYVITKNDSQITAQVVSKKGLTGGSGSLDISGVDIGDRTNDFMIGSWLGENQSWEGEVNEIAVFDRELSTYEKTLIQEYLALKWGIKLL